MRLERLAALAIAAYVTAVAMLVVVGVGPQPFASSPAGVARGELWELAASALVVADGPAALAIALLCLTGLWAVRRAGAVPALAAALAGHVGATLVAYAALSLARLQDPTLATGALHAPDYGVSCVLAAWLGLLVVTGRGWAERLLAAALLSLMAPPALTLTGWEHALAFVAGAGVGLTLTRHPRLTHQRG